MRREVSNKLAGQNVPPDGLRQASAVSNPTDKQKAKHASSPKDPDVWPCGLDSAFGCRLHVDKAMLHVC